MNSITTTSQLRKAEPETRITALVESIRTWSEKKGQLWVPSQYTPSYLLWSVETHQTKWTSRSRSHVFQLHCYFGFGDEAIEILGVWQYEASSWATHRRGRGTVLLWSTGQQGDHNPQALVNTMLYMNGIYFAAILVTVASLVMLAIV